MPVTGTLTLTDFLLARIAEDEAAERMSASLARKGRLVVRAAVLTLFPLSQYRVRQFAERWADHADYREEWRP